MGSQVEDAGARARGGTWVVIGLMAAIAVVAVTVVVVWARLGTSQAGAAPPTAAEPMPETLAAGNAPQPVPDAVAGAVDGPVLGAARLDELPDNLRNACLQFTDIEWDPGSPQVEYAFITTDGATASLFGQGDVAEGFGRGPGGMDPLGYRVRCDLEIGDGSATNRGGGGFEEVFEGPDGGGFMSSSCCDPEGRSTASASVSVPEGARWLLQERGGWFLAYPVDGLDTVAVSWKYRENRFGGGRPPQSRVVFVDDSGAVVGEGFAGGPF